MLPPVDFALDFCAWVLCVTRHASLRDRRCVRRRVSACVSLPMRPDPTRLEGARTASRWTLDLYPIMPNAGANALPTQHANIS